MAAREIEIHIDLAGRPRQVGTQWLQTTRGRETAAFRYHTAWLGDPERFSLEPVVRLGQGSFVPTGQRDTFGSLGVSVPLFPKVPVAIAGYFNSC